MNKDEIRYHNKVGNKIASVYIQETFLDHSTDFYGYDKGNTITTSYYDYIGICVSNSRRLNNDWWNGDRQGNKLNNKSTGNIKCLTTIVKTLERHIDTFFKNYNYYCCMIEYTDEHRKNTYDKMINHYCKKNNLKPYCVTVDDQTQIYLILK